MEVGRGQMESIRCGKGMRVEGNGYFRVFSPLLTPKSMNKKMKIAQFSPVQHTFLAHSSPALAHTMLTAYT